MSEPCDLSAVEARAQIAAGKMSPVELFDSCRSRIEQVNPALNAIVATDFERAREAAEIAEAAVAVGESVGPLHGLPIGIKDLNETAGLTTTFGSPVYADYVPKKDERLVAVVRAAGGIVTAKTNTPEFGAGANTVNQVYGFTGNPFDPERICGGSSGGSAVALATSMLPLASGSDLGGSLRTPAAYCGVVGYRPTPGVVADETKGRAWDPLAVQGPMARSVEDLCLFLSVLAGRHPGDPLSLPADPASLAAPRPADLSRLKVALSEDLGFAPIDEGQRKVFRERSSAFAGLFAACETADPDMGGADRIFEVLRAVGFLAAHKEFLEKYGEKVGPNVTANVKLGLTLSADDVAQASAEHTKLFHRFRAFMDRYDVLICPTASVAPFGKEKLFPSEINGAPLPTYISWMAITYGLTLTTHPVAVLPCGLDGTGMPFGIQVVGKWGRDAELLGVVRALEEALSGIENCRRPLPDLAALASA